MTNISDFLKKHKFSIVIDGSLQEKIYFISDGSIFFILDAKHRDIYVNQQRIMDFFDIRFIRSVLIDYNIHDYIIYPYNDLDSFNDIKTLPSNLLCEYLTNITIRLYSDTTICLYKNGINLIYIDMDINDVALDIANLIPHHIEKHLRNNHMCYCDRLLIDLYPTMDVFNGDEILEW